MTPGVVYWLKAVMNRPYYLYITTNPRKTTLYIGITQNLPQCLRKLYRNRGKTDTFPERYYCYNLVYYETFTTSDEATARAAQLKKWRRDKKEALIAKTNPRWIFLNYRDDFRGWR